MAIPPLPLSQVTGSSTIGGKNSIKSVRQTEYLIQLAEEAGLVLLPEDAARRGTVTCSYNAAAIAKELVQAIYYRLSPGVGVRISPHFYTSDQELEQ
jgi:hypothetical protein